MKIHERLFWYIIVVINLFSAPLFSADAKTYYSDVYQILFENCQLLPFLSHNEAVSLLSTSKFCSQFMAQYRKNHVNEFNEKYPLSGKKMISVTLEGEFLAQVNEYADRKEVNILPNSVIFDASGNYICAYSSLQFRPDDSDGIKLHYCKRFKLHYSSMKIKKMEAIELLSQHEYVNAIANNARSTSFFISRPYATLQNEICGIANTWYCASRPIRCKGDYYGVQLKYLSLRIFEDKEKKEDEVICAIFTCKFFEEKTDVQRYLWPAYDKEYEYLIEGAGKSIDIAERNPLTGEEYVLINT